MKAFFKDHTEATLIFCAIVFMAIIIWFFFATIQTVVSQVNRAVVTPSIPAEQGFDLQDAGKIDLRGIPISTPASNPGQNVSDGAPPAASASVTTSSQASTPTSSVAAPVTPDQGRE